MRPSSALAEPTTASSGLAPADAPTDAPTGSAEPEFDPSLRLPRRRHPHPEPRLVRLTTQGEYLLRLRSQTPVVLPRYGLDPSTERLAQGSRLVHRLRILPVLELGQRALLIAQADLPYGMIGGPGNRHVEAAREPWSEPQPLRAELRWLYGIWTAPGLELRAGQQPAHWGLGLLENDGDHSTWFGDPVAGTRVERVAVTLLPRRDRVGMAVTLAGDLVLSDPLAELRSGDVAWRGVVAIEQGRERPTGSGVLLMARRQRGPLEGAVSSHHAELTLFTADVAARAATPLGAGRGWLYLAGEVALHHGSWNQGVPLHGSGGRSTVLVRAHGGAVRAGAIVVPATSGHDRRWGRLVSELEWGWASGDADPHDGVDRRFRFAPSHRIGSLLFEEVLAWKTARAAVIAADPALTPRPRPEGIDLATNGSVTGATYMAPMILLRPWPDLDLKLGAVVAQSTADFVDPVRVFTDGRYLNYDGGDPRAHDFGLELDVGLELRVPFPTGVVAEIGVESAVLLPGFALADVEADRNPTALQATTRLGLRF